MIVWGGHDYNSNSDLSTGGRYNPITDTWTVTSITNAPTGGSTTGVWIGNEMIVWGGDGNSYVNTGGRYNPATDNWTSTSITNAPVGRSTKAVWTGSEFIVWGGENGYGYLITGGRYNPVTDTWAATSTTNASLRASHAAVWTGSEMIVWGGYNGSVLNTGGRYCGTYLTVNISGNISRCSNPSLGPASNVTLTLTGDVATSAITDSSGNYVFSFLPSGGNYDVTPSKAALTPGSAGINTVDVIAAQKHFLNLGTPLSGCQLTAADVNGDNLVNTSDVIAIKRFFLGFSTGIANTGKYKFAPVSRSYLKVVTDQSGQNYDALIFGDVASPFAE